MYYRYNEKCEIIEKSEEELTGDNVATYDFDLDIDLFRIIIGSLSEDGYITRHTKIVRNPEVIARIIQDYRECLDNHLINQAESELYIEERLCNIELGFY